MMISSHVIIKYLKEHYDGKSIYVVGTTSLIQEFQYFDMNLTEEDPDIVVLGFDTTLTYEKLSKACQETGYEPDEIAIVGDRLYTDIAVADQSDVMSILVLSGESTREDVKTSDVKPNVILEDLSEITKML